MKNAPIKEELKEIVRVIDWIGLFMVALGAFAGWNLHVIWGC